MSKYLIITIVAALLLSVQEAKAGARPVSSHLKFLLLSKDYPSDIARLKPSSVYITYTRSNVETKFYKFIRNDTVINYSGLLDSLKTALYGYRLLFKNTRGGVDSISQLNSDFKLEFKAFPDKIGIASIHTYDGKNNLIGKYIFNYRKKDSTLSFSNLSVYNPLFTAYDQNNYFVSSVWLVSIGIDDYGDTQYKTCQSDAKSYNEFFKKQLWKLLGKEYAELYHGFLLLNKNASKDSIIKVLKYIISNATTSDYFVFIFSGSSRMLTEDSVTYSTYFDTYGASMRSKLSTKEKKELLSLEELQNLIQFIPSENQLFISEAGPSKKFKSEFIQSLIKNSPQVARVLNKNRIIIVPDSIGYEGLRCDTGFISKGPINYYITSLDTAYNIYELFQDNYKAANIGFQLKAKDYKCKPIKNAEYFEVFYEKKFLSLYQDLFGDGVGATRGGRVSEQRMNKAAGLTGKKYALIIGTDNYKGKSWKKLKNPILDATAISDELEQSYGFNVTQLSDPPLDTIYKAIRNFYQTLTEEDQLIVYFAGHGDVDEGLLDDGFIVCTDSKSLDEDPIRNTYIQQTKLKKMINKIPAKQILIILDICHAGFIDEDVWGAALRENPESGTINMNVMRFLEEKAKYRSRRILTSVGKESALDGKAGKSSPFANLLLQVLRSKGEGSNGIVTLGSIHSVLERAGANAEPEFKISPHLAKFGNDDPFGDFILIPVAKTNDVAKAK